MRKRGRRAPGGFPARLGLLLLCGFAVGAACAQTGSQPPQLIESATPDYPEALRNAGIAGVVVVQFGLDATGAVKNVAVFTSDHPELEAPALDAVRKWKFKPTMKDGQAVEVPLMRVPITFAIPPTAFRYVANFGDALRQADQEHKVVFVDFYTTWCEPCKRLDKDTWQNPAVIALLKDKAVALRIDAEKAVPLATHYGVTAYPTLALIRPDGTVIEKLVGYRDAPTFTGEFTDALAGRTNLVQARGAVAAAGADPEELAKTRYALGQALALDGENAEALTEFLWCFDTGMKQAPSYRGVRASFLVQDLAALARAYPPARDALTTRRDADKGSISSDREAASDFGSINHYLGEDSDTLAAFGTLPAGSPSRVALGFWVFDGLIAARRYGDALDAVPLAYARSQLMVAPSAPKPSDRMRGYISESAAKELEALAGAGRLDDARDLLKAELEFDPSEATAGMIRGHLERAGHADLMPKPPAAPAPAP